MAEYHQSQESQKQPPKIYLASKEELDDKIRESEETGAIAISDSVYHSFIDQVAGTRKEPQGIVLAWQMAIGIELQKAPPEDFPVLSKYYNLQFYRMVDIVVPDPKAAAVTKEYMLDFEGKLRGENRE